MHWEFFAFLSDSMLVSADLLALLIVFFFLFFDPITRQDLEHSV